MRVLGFHPATLAATFMLLLAGCGGVSFEHPLSDPATTEIDESLIGFWEPVASSIGEPDPGPGDLVARIAVGKTKQGGKAMEAVALEIEDGVVQVKRLEVLATRIGDHRYLSLRDPEESDKSWFVIRYEVTDEDLLRGQILDAEAFAAAVDAGELKGEVTSRDRGHEAAGLTVQITSGTDEVRTWLAQHEGCVESKGITLRRLVKRESSGSAHPDADPDAPAPPEPPAPPKPPGPPLEPDEPSPPAEPDDDADDSEGPNEEDDAEDQE